MDLGTYLLVWDNEDNCYHAESRYLQRIAEAVTQYLDTGRDSLLQLTAVSGDIYVLRASAIRVWQVTTPEGRKAEIEMQLALEFEAQAIKHELGIWDDEE